MCSRLRSPLGPHLGSKIRMIALFYSHILLFISSIMKEKEREKGVNVVRQRVIECEREREIKGQKTER